jgi:2-dehydropantoate 2-reductase
MHAHLQGLTDLLGRAGLVVETVTDIRSVQWGKLVINAAINPITAILGIPNGELLQRPAARSLLQTTAREVAAVAVARGVHLPFPDPVIACEAVASQTAANYSSMLQDIRREAPTEIDFINGAVVRAGEKTGVATPVNRALTLLVRAMRGG